VLPSASPRPAPRLPWLPRLRPPPPPRPAASGRRFRAPRPAVPAFWGRLRAATPSTSTAWTSTWGKLGSRSPRRPAPRCRRRHPRPRESEGISIRYEKRYRVPSRREFLKAAGAGGAGLLAGSVSAGVGVAVPGAVTAPPPAAVAGGSSGNGGAPSSSVDFGRMFRICRRSPTRMTRGWSMRSSRLGCRRDPGRKR